MIEKSDIQYKIENKSCKIITNNGFYVSDVLLQNAVTLYFPEFKKMSNESRNSIWPGLSFSVLFYTSLPNLDSISKLESHWNLILSPTPLPLSVLSSLLFFLSSLCPILPQHIDEIDIELIKLSDKIQIFFDDNIHFNLKLKYKIDSKISYN